MRWARTLSFLGVLGATACATQADEPSGGGAEDLTAASRAEQVLYGGAHGPAQCASGVDDTRIRCLIAARYAQDPAARDVALDLYASTGGVPGVLPAQELDGGYRGTIELVPELPIGTYRMHLEFVRYAMRDFEWFFSGLARSASKPIAYRFRDVDLRFFRSVGRTTPSAFTEGKWEVSYNVSGTLVSTAPSARETLFHELFHVNDWTHQDWSARMLTDIVQGIVARCGTSTACLAPYTPTETMVHGGTYYAFQPNNGNMVFEYAAELAVRYLTEEHDALAGVAAAKPAFKCGPIENRRAWALIRDEFFGGADLVSACP